MARAKSGDYSGTSYNLFQIFLSRHMPALYSPGAQGHFWSLGLSKMFETSYCPGFGIITRGLFSRSERSWLFAYAPFLIMANTAVQKRAHANNRECSLCWTGLRLDPGHETSGIVKFYYEGRCKKVTVINRMIEFQNYLYTYLCPVLSSYHKQKKIFWHVRESLWHAQKQSPTGELFCQAKIRRKQKQR
jgi:hypothetical protein